MSFPKPSEFIAIVHSWTPEERAAIMAALSPPAAASKKATAAKSAAAAPERPTADLSERPEMPEEVELDEDYCAARVGIKLAKEDIVDADKDDWLGRESGLKFGGFRSKIYLEQQCTSKPEKGKRICAACAKNLEKHDPAKWTNWKGYIDECPPPKCRFIRSDYSNASYEAWGDAPRSGPSSAKKSADEPKAEAKAKKEVKAKAKEEKPAKAKKEAKKEGPSNAAAVAPPPAAAEKKPTPVISDELVYNLHCDCFINPEGVCFYADMDEEMKPIPAMDKIIGSIPKKGDKPLTVDEREEVEEYTEAEEPEEE